MKISLEWVPCHNQWALFATELGDEPGYNPSIPPPWGSERQRFNSAVSAEAKVLGLTVFNQMQWTMTSGWEYWADDNDKILAHAESVAKHFGVPLEMGLVYG